MGLADDMADDVAAIFTDETGPAVAAVYTAKGGSAADITLFEMPESVEVNTDSGGEYRLARKVAAIQLAEVPNPLCGDTVTLSGTVWQVDRIRSKFVLAVVELVEVVNTQRADEGRIRRPR